jgi:glycine cleavage system H protein|uniref:Glycine cleavage system protein GcvH n=1 Tax=Desulfobacca acetoxidans TaxID=60893 RepID=A0A7V6A6B1_9BACT
MLVKFIDCEIYHKLLPTVHGNVKEKPLHERRPESLFPTSGEKGEKNLAKCFSAYYISHAKRDGNLQDREKEDRAIGEIRFSRDHLWIRLDDDNRATLGITDYLQEKLGEIYSLPLPEEGEEIVKDEPFSSVEAKNGRRELIAPISGEIVELNYETIEVPEIVNEDPMSEGWLLKVEISSSQEFDDLLTEDEYEDFLVEEEEEGEED